MYILQYLGLIRLVSATLLGSNSNHFVLAFRAKFKYCLLKIKLVELSGINMYLNI